MNLFFMIRVLNTYMQPIIIILNDVIKIHMCIKGENTDLSRIIEFDNGHKSEYNMCLKKIIID
jgi:hypothetical protein